MKIIFPNFDSFLQFLITKKKEAGFYNQSLLHTQNLGVGRAKNLFFRDKIFKFSNIVSFFSAIYCD